MRCNKRAYLFVVDAFIALSVLVIAFFIVFTFYSRPSYFFQQQVLAEDVVAHLSTRSVESYVTEDMTLTEMYREGDISSLDSTIAQELFLDMRNKAGIIGDSCDVDDADIMSCVLMGIVMEEFDDEQYNLVVKLTGGGRSIVFYNNSWTEPSDAQSFVVENFVLFANDAEQVGQSEYSRSRIIGPATLTVMVW